jgi:hypothetical protein
LVKVSSKNLLISIFYDFLIAYTLAWKHMSGAPMFPNFMSSTLGIKFNLLKSEKNHGERKFFPHQEDFLKFTLR